ncbi:unnamed protein product [Gadus morhua 'NCC']
MGCLGWLCILVATSTNNWVIMCKYGTNACKKSEESNIKGPWAECSVSSAHYECQPLTLILKLPAYIHTIRALMITASTLALLAVVLLLMSLPCISLGEPPKAKSRRAVLGGLCFLSVGRDCPLVEEMRAEEDGAEGRSTNFWALCTRVVVVAGDSLERSRLRVAVLGVVGISSPWPPPVATETPAAAAADRKVEKDMYKCCCLR